MSSQFWVGVLSVVMIDLVLAGDNAVVIAMAARRLAPRQRNQAICWGTIGAIIIRVLMTMVAVWLLKIPLLQAVGGVLLIFVAHKLLAGGHPHAPIASRTSLLKAIQTIIAADGIMGLDNVLAIAGTAHGNMVLVIIGLTISIPIVIWGSKWISLWMNRLPILLYLGAAILCWTAASMIVEDALVSSTIISYAPWLSWLLPLLILFMVLGPSKLKIWLFFYK